LHGKLHRRSTAVDSNDYNLWYNIYL
jgi:hypothetical protein